MTPQNPIAPQPGTVSSSAPAAPQQVSDAALQVANRFGRLRTVIGKGMSVEGAVSFDSPVQIEGTLKGRLFSSAAVVIAPGADVQCEGTVAVLQVYGRYRGSIKATEKVEVCAGGDLEGDVIAPVLSLEEGGRFNGRSSMVGQLERKNRIREQLERSGASGSEAETPSADSDNGERRESASIDSNIEVYTAPGSGSFSLN